MRIISNLVMAMALAGFIVPSTASNADAGKRYKHSGKHRSHGYNHRRHRNNGFVLRIPASYLNRRYYEPTDFTNRSFRGGPKIINVQKTLRERRRRELLD